MLYTEAQAKLWDDFEPDEPLTLWGCFWGLLLFFGFFGGIAFGVAMVAGRI